MKRKFRTRAANKPGASHQYNAGAPAKLLRNYSKRYSHVLSDYVAEKNLAALANKAS